MKISEHIKSLQDMMAFGGDRPMVFLEDETGSEYEISGARMGFKDSDDYSISLFMRKSSPQNMPRQDAKL